MHEQVRPSGPLEMPGVWYGGLRLMALDGSTLDMPDEQANAAHIGYPGTPRGSSAFPQLRFVALAECGTHTLCFANLGPCRNNERVLAEAVLDRADASILIMADRNFHSYSFWQHGCATGAKLLFRVKSNLRLPCKKRLSYGSYLTTLYSNDRDRRCKHNGIQARVIEYTLEGVPDAESSYRLLSNWLDGDVAPARDLAALYHRRWTIEQVFDEFKVHLAERAVILRSKRPELVEQEFYPLLLAHAAVRRLMTQAAVATEKSAEDLSFTHAVRVLRRRLPVASAIPP